jgi:hypothetical protein
MPKSNEKLIHIVAITHDQKTQWSPQQEKDLQKLIKWLEEHGESLDVAKTDIERWRSYSIGPPEEYRRKMDAEVAEREAREAREKKAAKKPAQKP